MQINVSLMKQAMLKATKGLKKFYHCDFITTSIRRMGKVLFSQVSVCQQGVVPQSQVLS